MTKLFIIEALAIALAAAAGCSTMQETDPAVLAENVRQELTREPADSDAALILSQALDDFAAAAPAGQTVVLTKASKRAAAARRFKIAGESPLPSNWPKPSLPGLIRIKSYPPARSAWVRAPEKRNGQFMVLFRHIQAEKIAMTAPVVMEYATQAGNAPSKLGATEAMAFLYRRPDQGKTGDYGDVVVENDRPVQVVSVGLQGSYRKANFRKALDGLRQWLDEHSQWRLAGPPRVLAYNSPFMPWWNKYSEVQIPVQAVPSDKIGQGQNATTE